MRDATAAVGSSQWGIRAASVLLVLALGVVFILLVAIEPGRNGPNRSINMTYYPEPVAKPGYTLEHRSIGDRGIAAYLLSRDEPGGRRPAVILVHGGGITDPLEFAKPQYKGEWLIPHFETIPYSLAEAGILVVMIDAWWAGERHKPEHDVLAKADPFGALFRGFVETTRDVSQVIDYLAGRDDVDAKRIGVAGKSGGGITSLMAACAEDRLEAVVAWKAGADFIEIGRLRGQAMLVNKTLHIDSGFEEEVRAADPIHQYGRIPPKALALIGNREDPLMPRQAAEKLYEKLRSLYESNPDRLLLKLFETPRPTHDLGAEAFALGCDWLVEHLVTKGGASPSR